MSEVREWGVEIIVRGKREGGVELAGVDCGGSGGQEWPVRRLP